MISLIFSLEIINIVLLDLNDFLLIGASVPASAVVNPNGIKSLLSTFSNTFPIKNNAVFSNVYKSLPRNPPDYPILCSWVLDKFTLAEELFAKAYKAWNFPY